MLLRLRFLTLGGFPLDRQIRRSIYVRAEHYATCYVSLFVLLSGTLGGEARVNRKRRLHLPSKANKRPEEWKPVL
jgi:hypothetical protein